MEFSVTKAKALNTLNSLEWNTSNIGTNSNNNEKLFKGMALSKNKHKTQSVTDARFDIEKIQWKATYSFTVGITKYHRQPKSYYKDWVEHCLGTL